MARTRGRKQRNRSAKRRSKTRRRKTRGRKRRGGMLSGVLRAAKTALLPFLLFKAQKKFKSVETINDVHEEEEEDK